MFAIVTRGLDIVSDGCFVHYILQQMSLMDGRAICFQEKLGANLIVAIKMACDVPDAPPSQIRARE